MKVLIAGGAGFIGAAVVRRLAARGHAVRVLSRDAARVKARFPNLPVEAAAGDVREAAALPSAVEGCESVVMTVQFPGHPAETPRKGWTYLATDLVGTRNLVQAARAAGVAHFIYLSGAGTREGRTQTWFAAKWGAEQAVRESGLAHTILRPSWIYGPEDRSLNKFRLFARLPLLPIPVIGDGKTRIEPVFVEDVADLIARCVEEEKARGRVLEVGGPETLTMDEVIRTLLAAMGRRRFLLHHPKGLMKLLARLFLQFVPGAFRLTPAAIDFVTMENPVDRAALREVFPDFAPRPLREALATYVGG